MALLDLLHSKNKEDNHILCLNGGAISTNLAVICKYKYLDEDKCINEWSR